MADAIRRSDVLASVAMFLIKLGVIAMLLSKLEVITYTTKKLKTFSAANSRYLFERSEGDPKI